MPTKFIVTAVLLSVLLSVGCATVPHTPSTLRRVQLEEERTDALLERGDILFRYVDANDPLDAVISGAVIQAGAVTAESTFAAGRLTEDVVNELLQNEGEHFERALIDGDPSAVHMAVYLGGGETAEAFGSTADDARVNVWNLFAPYHRSTAWRVVRHRDPRMREAIADVARRWAEPARMGYRLPMEVFVQDATWGQHARSTALEFASAFEASGGPSSYDDMFCSQFVVAAVQSAAARVYLDGDLSVERMEELPAEAQIDAVASPLRAYGHWASSDAFDVVAHVFVR